jgi:hypothetical protein
MGLLVTLHYGILGQKFARLRHNWEEDSLG